MCNLAAIKDPFQPLSYLFDCCRRRHITHMAMWFVFLVGKTRERNVILASSNIHCFVEYEGRTEMDSDSELLSNKSLSETETAVKRGGQRWKDTTQMVDMWKDCGDI